jgi:hypothetical protein
LAPAVCTIVSALLLAAHFLRQGEWPLVAVAVLAPWLLRVRTPWARRLLQGLLALATLEWLRTALLFVHARRLTGEPWMRLALILGVVALFTAGAALLVGRSGRRMPANPTRTGPPAP